MALQQAEIVTVERERLAQTNGLFFQDNLGKWAGERLNQSGFE